MFSTREHGQVGATILGEHSRLNAALAELISSLPPRGAPGRARPEYCTAEFYRACGGERPAKTLVPPPEGVRSRLNGSPLGLRIALPRCPY